VPFFALALLVLFVVRPRPLDAQGQGAANEFNDSHFHLTNYIQQAIEARRSLRSMAPVWKGLTPEASLKVRKGTYERIFNEGRQRVRQWEKTNVKGVR